VTHSPSACVIIGAGGHASVLIDCMRRAGTPRPDCVIDADASRWDTEWLGLPIIGGDETLAEMRGRGIRSFVVGVGRVGATDRRRPLFAQALAAALDPAAVVDPSAFISDRAIIGPGAQILPKAVINIGATIGANAVVNTAAVIEHDCVVGDHAFIAPGAILGGGVSVGEGAFIGLGAIVLPGIEIGPGAVIGAGAVVHESVVPAATVIGIPARRLEAAR
jgi:UDP-perosamine 4-acetyltransferase